MESIFTTTTIFPLDIVHFSRSVFFSIIHNLEFNGSVEMHRDFIGYFVIIESLRRKLSLDRSGWKLLRVHSNFTKFSDA